MVSMLAKTHGSQRARVHKRRNVLTLGDSDRLMAIEIPRVDLRSRVVCLAIRYPRETYLYRLTRSPAAGPYR